VTGEFGAQLINHLVPSQGVIMQLTAPQIQQAKMGMSKDIPEAFGLRSNIVR
jgi:uncharacterized pyridoxal phosphate-containing UPF0001 family protein